MFGAIPAYGFSVRHVNGIEMNDVEVGYLKDEMRPALLLDSDRNASFEQLRAQHAPGVPALVLRNVSDFEVHRSRGVPYMVLKDVKEKSRTFTRGMPVGKQAWKAESVLYAALWTPSSAKWRSISSGRLTLRTSLDFRSSWGLPCATRSSLCPLMADS